MIERCQDYRRIKKFPDWPLWISSRVYYLIEVKDGIDLGVWTFEPAAKSNIDFTIHASLGEDCRGKDAIGSARQAFHWMFMNTDCAHIHASIPNDKRHAQFMASWSGMKLQSSDKKRRNYKIEFSDIIGLFCPERMLSYG